MTRNNETQAQGRTQAVERAVEVLRAHPPLPPAPAARVRMLEEIEAATTQRQFSWFPMGGLVLAGAAAIALLVALPEGESPMLPEAKPVEIAAAPRVLEIAEARVQYAEGSSYSIPRNEPGHGVLSLEQGHVDVAVTPMRAPGHSFRVQTPHAEVRVVGTRFTVDSTDAGTDVSVSEGIVEVRRLDTKALRRLTAGESLHIAAQQAKSPVQAPAPIAPAPEPEPDRPAKVSTSTASQAHRSSLAKARALITTDTAQAETLAKEVLAHRPSQTIEAEALAVLADAARLGGAHQKAADLYGQVAAHPRGAPFAEEAAFRRALLLGRKLSRRAEALEVLEKARTKHAGGALQPERCELEIRWLRAENRVAAAQALVEGACAKKD